MGAKKRGAFGASSPGITTWFNCDSSTEYMKIYNYHNHLRRTKRQLVLVPAQLRSLCLIHRTHIDPRLGVWQVGYIPAPRTMYAWANSLVRLAGLAQCPLSPFWFQRAPFKSTTKQPESVFLP